MKTKTTVESKVREIKRATKRKFSAEEKIRINEMWQTDFKYFKIIPWGWYFLSTVMDDYSRYVISWDLRSNMTSEDVKPCHPQTQGKIERYHRKMKNVVKIENYYSPEELEYAMANFVDICL